MNSTVRSLFTSLTLIALFATDYRTQGITRKIDEYMIAAVKAGKFSGAVLISRQGEVLVSKGYGLASLELDAPNNPKTKFRIGSITKQFTAMAIMILQERGKLNVQDSICKYVSECPQTWTGITIHHLLTHTSGIPDLTAFPDFQITMALPSPVAQTVERFRNKPLEFKPGARFSYSNSGYVLLGYIIERASGQSYEVFLQDNIFAPLGMANSGTDHNDLVLKNRAAGYSKLGEAIINAPYIDMSIPTGGGSLYSTVEDLFLWDQALSSERLVSKKSLEAIFNSYQTADWGDGVGYGWFIIKDKSGRRAFGHRGGINGFASYITRYPDEKALVVVLSNFSFTPISDISNDLAAILFGGQAESK